jgi:putative Flp pilus-assembly TadE/G-like protein
MVTLVPSIRSERGAALVMVVIWLPVLLLFFMFVVDVGNWFMHKRHLQMQADAGALAGGGIFRIPCVDTPILDATRKYAGDPSASGPYNLQVRPTNQANVHALINATTYWNKGGVDYNDGGQPCATKFVDVKMTEANLPWWMRLAVVPAINAHARVSILEKTGGAGTLPVGVPDSNPVAAAAIFVNEVNGTVIGTETLSFNQNLTLNGETLGEWVGGPVSVNIASARTGVVIALAGKAGWTPSGSLSQMCNQVLVQCYEGLDTGPWTGLSFIQGYQTSGGTPGPNNAVARDVTLYNVGCLDDSAPYFLRNAGCSVGVKAKIDFGVIPGGNPEAAPPNGISAVVKVDGWGCPNGSPKGCTMRYVTSGPDAGYWMTNGSNGYPVMPTAGGPHQIDLNYKTSSTSGQGKTLLAAQRSFTASTTLSGAVDYVTVSELGLGANSLSFGTHSLSVAIGVKGSLQANASSVNDPVVHLKITGGTSQTQALDCDPNGFTLRDEIGYGCAPQYVKNTGQACPAANDPLWGDTSTQPWNCVNMKTGNSAGQVNQGMLIRTQEGSNSCLHPNNWSLFPDLPPGDPRIVPVFLVPFGSFSGSGSNTTVPVIGFATFYVTGWSQGNGGSQGDPCPNADAVNGGGEITGHFIKYVDSLNTGGGGALCDFGSLGTCVAVLTE